MIKFSNNLFYVELAISDMPPPRWILGVEAETSAEILRAIAASAKRFAIAFEISIEECFGSDGPIAFLSNEDCKAVASAIMRELQLPIYVCCTDARSTPYIPILINLTTTFDGKL